MRSGETWSERLGPWKIVSTPALITWLLFYAAFLIYAATNRSGFLFIDNVNLIVHEGGHLLFGWFGQTLGLWGGTLLQWLVPALLAAYFFLQRQTTGYSFCLFIFFENFLYTATYMADARAQALPLVSVGESDNPHDWFNIFSSLGLLQHDTQIASVVRFLGFTGMLATVIWMGWRGRARPEPQGV
ncbi:MAG: hypothetical protein ACM3JB_07935 [Acidobacteriaceae bacterium]